MAESHVERQKIEQPLSQWLKSFQALKDKIIKVGKGLRDHPVQLLTKYSDNGNTGNQTALERNCSGEIKTWRVDQWQQFPPSTRINPLNPLIHLCRKTGSQKAPVKGKGGWGCSLYEPKHPA